MGMTREAYDHSHTHGDHHASGLPDLPSPCSSCSQPQGSEIRAPWKVGILLSLIRSPEVRVTSVDLRSGGPDRQTVSWEVSGPTELLSGFVVRVYPSGDPRAMRTQRRGPESRTCTWENLTPATPYVIRVTPLTWPPGPERPDGPALRRPRPSPPATTVFKTDTAPEPKDPDRSSTSLSQAWLNGRERLGSLSTHPHQLPQDQSHRLTRPHARRLRPGARGRGPDLRLQGTQAPYTYFMR